jgi:glucokinase
VKTLAVDLGGTKFTLAVFDGDRMVRREQRATDQAGGAPWMLQQIENLVTAWRRDFRFDRCGIGFGGPVHFAGQRVALSTHVGGWNNVPLTARLSEIAGAAAIMDNDANVGALGEYRFGAGRDCSPLLYLTLSTGIGGGIVLDGRVLRGPDSWAGEIGHLNVEPNGPACLCGSNGCLERMCCGLWLERDHGRPARELLQNPEFVRPYVVPLARGIKAAIMLLNPQRIVIGGGIGKAGDRLFLPLRAELARQMPPWSQARVDVVPAEWGDDSVLLGALALAQQHA